MSRLTVALLLCSLAATPAVSQPSRAAAAQAAIRDLRRQEPIIRELVAMGAMDRLMRERFLALRGPASDAERRALDEVWKAEYKPIDNENTVRLKAMLRGRGWFTASEVGPQAVEGAYLIVSHSSDLAFQADALAKMEALPPAERPSGYPNLFDRVAEQQGRPQRYGTQIRDCAGDRHAAPTNVEDPPNLDARRKAVSLPPMPAYLAQMDKMYGRCTPKPAP